MKKTIVECDRCGRMYGELDYVGPVIKYHQKDEMVVLSFTHLTSSMSYGDAYPMLDLCPECRNEFSLWFIVPRKE